MGWTVRASNPGGGARFYSPVQTGSEAHLTSYTMDTGTFPGLTVRGVALPTHIHIKPRLKKQ